MVSRHEFVAPFTIRFTINIGRLAPFWTKTFACPDVTTDEKSFILSVLANYTDRFSAVKTETECMNTFESWVFNSVEQAVYINMGVNYSPLFDVFEYLYSVGFCDTSVVYIDDIAAVPVLTSAPSISQEQDLINNDVLAYNMGAVQFANESRALDYLRRMSLFANDVFMSYLKYDGRSEYSRSELKPIAHYLIQDITIGKTKGEISLDDPRKANNVPMPKHLFSLAEYPDADEDLVDVPVPLLFGEGTVPAICTNKTVKIGSVSFRAAEYLAALGTIQVRYDDKWHNVPPLSYDISKGEFNLSDTAGRGITNKGEWSGSANLPTLSNATGVEGWYYACTATGTVNFGAGDVTVNAGEYVAFSDGRWSSRQEMDTEPRETRLVSCAGYPSQKPSVVISKLEEIGNDIPYTSSFYDMDEINAEEVGFEPISLYLSEQEELNEIIRTIQEGSSFRFRYEFNANGLRTIRKDDYARESSIFVSYSEILENGELDLYTDKPTIAASIKINYGNNFTSDKRLSVIDSSVSAAVAANIRSKPQIAFDTFLPTRELAVARAALEVSRLGTVRRFSDNTLRGERFIYLRIYDILTVELIDEDREWAGTWRCQVLRIKPDTVKLQNKVKLLLVERVEDIDYGRTLRVTSSGNIRKTTTSNDKVRVTK